MKYQTLLVLLLLLPFSGCLEHGLAPTDENAVVDTLTGFSGEITFIGDWPDSSEECWMVVYKNYPRNIFDVMNMTAKDSIPLFVDSYPYFMPVEADSYALVFVAFLQKGSTWGLNSVAGVYYENSDSSWPGGVVVNEREITRGIDIVVDFDNIPVAVPIPTLKRSKR